MRMWIGLSPWGPAPSKMWSFSGASTSRRTFSGGRGSTRETQAACCIFSVLSLDFEHAVVMNAWEHQLDSPCKDGYKKLTEQWKLTSPTQPQVGREARGLDQSVLLAFRTREFSSAKKKAAVMVVLTTGVGEGAYQVRHDGHSSGRLDDIVRMSSDGPLLDGIPN